MAALFILVVGLPVRAGDLERWIPEHCNAHSPGSRAEASWNDSYREGFRAIERGEYHVAETEMCRALLAAREFGPRDWRFAETLDELGLIAFEQSRFDLAERLEGAAVAEMLLAVGPQGEPLQGLEASPRAVIRPDCASGIGVYIRRLGWIHERAPGLATAEELHGEPWRVFAAGYLPLDAELAERLTWLISQYILQEDLKAAEALTELQQELVAD